MLFVQGLILGTNAATDPIEVDAAAKERTVMTKVARATDEVVPARLLRAF